MKMKVSSWRCRLVDLVQMQGVNINTKGAASINFIFVILFRNIDI